jgi:hypothetical protein
MRSRSLVRSALLAGAFLAGLSLAAFVVIPGAIGRYARSSAAARGVVLSFDRVRLGWLRAFIDGARCSVPEIPGVEVSFAAVEVDLDARLRPKSLMASGGKATIASGDALRVDFESWRAKRGASAEPSGGTALALSLSFDEVSVGLPGGHASARGLGIHREGGSVEVGVATLEAALGAAALTVHDGSLVLEGSPLTFRRARAGNTEVAWVDPTKPDLADGAAGTSPAMPAAPEIVPSGHSKRPKGPASQPAPVPVPRLLPDLHAVRSALAGEIALVTARIPEGGQVHVDSLGVRIVQGGEELTLGSGALEVDRDAQRISVTFSTSPLVRATPLSIKALLPTGHGDIELSAAGGPVPLGLLGLRNGGLLHLLDVDRTAFAGRGRVVLDDQGQSLTFDVEGSVKALSLNDPRLARAPIRGMDLGVSARGLMDDKGELRIDDAAASVGAARATLHGGLRQTAEHLAAAFDFDFPTSSCQALLTSIPSALVPTVGGARMDGTISLRGRLAFDTQHLDDLAFDFDVSDRCRLVDVPPELEKERFSRSFSHLVYSKKGEIVEETTGPGTPAWAELDEISPYMQVAVLTTEDGAFFHHHGFNHTAIRRAVAANIKAHRFVRGASTITMQLAKNLFLSREKTLARKLEELVLADYLEQAFTKDEMIELYLNIIEFGPDLYGVTAAAEHYFARRPSELNLAECMFLSSILPNPIAFHHVYEEAQLGEGWMRTIRARMEVAARNGLISPAELAEGLTETVVFHHEGAPRPAPRPPVSTPGHPAAASDWQELN